MWQDQYHISVKYEYQGQRSNTKVRDQGQLCESFDIVTHECFDIVASFLVCDKTSTISRSGLNTKVRGQILRSEVKVKFMSILI